MDINEKLNELLANPDFYVEGKDVASVEDFVELLRKHDVELTNEQAEAVLAQVGMLIEQQSGELSAEDLEHVAGGGATVVVGGISVVIKGVVGSTVFGAGLGVAVGVAAVAGACWYAKKKGWL